MTTPVLPLFEYEVGQLARTVLAKCAMTDQDYPYALEATRAVYGLLWGHLRGRVPLPLGVDLRAVVLTAATRYNLGLAAARGAKPVGDEAVPTFPTFTGFTFAEMVVIKRYRKEIA